MLQKLWLELNEESNRFDQCTLPETLLMMRILSTLPNEYLEFRTTWESVARDQRNVTYLLERLTMVEMRVSKKSSDDSLLISSVLVADQNAAARHAGSMKKTHFNKTKQKKDYSKIKCYKCGEIGHKKINCPKSAEEQKKGATFYGQALMAETHCDIWVADSGATRHMTKSHGFYTSYSTFREPKPVMTSNQRFMLAYGSGDIAVEALVDGVWTRHIMKDVSYTPDVAKNLFSIPSTADKGFEYWLDNKQCRIIRDGETFVVGERHQGLYRLCIRVLQPDVPAQVCIVTKTESLQVWHERFGHQSKVYVEKFLKRRGIVFTKGNKLCEHCVLGKHHSISFGTRTHDVKQPGDLVHSDVCGPMQEASFSGYNYFVVFKDEYSKFCTVYFMKGKFEVTQKLKCFLSEVKTLGHVIKELLTDGGGEYNSNELTKITLEAGLHHRKSMPYTSEQNGTAERENRTLVEAARSMLQAKQLPNKLWAEALNTAVHVINRTGPTKVADKTPYELWYGKSTPTDLFKAFGTECYVHVHKQRRQKWDVKALRGILVGYCADKDGYRIYVPQKHDVILSRDVTFKDEEVAAHDNTDEAVLDKDESDDEDTVDIQFIEQLTSPVLDDVRNDRALRDKKQIRAPPRFEDYAMLATDMEPATYTEAVQLSKS